MAFTGKSSLIAKEQNLGGPLLTEKCLITSSLSLCSSAVPGFPLPPQLSWAAHELLSSSSQELHVACLPTSSPGSNFRT